VSTATRLRARVDRSLRTRSAPKGTARARTEEVLKKLGDKAWLAMKRRPSLGVLAAAGLGVALASAIGVGELAIGLVAGYGAFQVLAEGVPLKDVVRRAAEEVGKVAS
jgi:hypothetical protein